MTLDDAFANTTKLGIDTAPIIYFIEANPRYDQYVIEVFQRIANNVLTGITSVITLTEVLTRPLQQGEIALQRRYRNLLSNSENFELISITPEIAEKAADLRAKYNLRTPDALQLSVSIATGCQAFLTNDRTLKRVVEVRVVLLDELQLRAE